MSDLQQLPRINYGARMLAKSGTGMSQWYDDLFVSRERSEHDEIRRIQKLPLVDQLVHWYGMHEDAACCELEYFLGACPDLTMRFFLHPDRVVQRTRPVQFGIEHLPDTKANGLWMAHGLSAQGDTIALLADIGRALRITYALRSPNLRIVLADPSWAANSLAGH